MSSGWRAWCGMRARGTASRARVHADTRQCAAKATQTRRAQILTSQKDSISVHMTLAWHLLYVEGVGGGRHGSEQSAKERANRVHVLNHRYFRNLFAPAWACSHCYARWSRRR